MPAGAGPLPPPHHLVQVHIRDAASPIAIPGIAGVLRLDPALIVNLPPVTIGSAGYAPVDVSIPPQPALRGARLHFQLFYADAGRFRLGNLQGVTFR